MAKVVSPTQAPYAFPRAPAAEPAPSGALPGCQAHWGGALAAGGFAGAAWCLV